MEIDDIQENEDGSADIVMHLTYDELIAFAKIGIQKAISDKIDEVFEEGERTNWENTNNFECYSPEPEKICEGCTCWKNQNE